MSRGWPGTTEVPTLYVFSETAKNPPRLLMDCVANGVKVVLTDDPWSWTQTDLYVQRAGLSWQAEKAAAHVGLVPILLPEQTDYLTAEINRRLKLGDVYVFCPSRVGQIPPTKGDR